MKDFPVEFQQHFEAALLDGKVTCVTPCNPAHSKQLICENKGTCEVSENGPSC